MRASSRCLRRLSDEGPLEPRHEAGFLRVCRGCNLPAVADEKYFETLFRREGLVCATCSFTQKPEERLSASPGEKWGRKIDADENFGGRPHGIRDGEIVLWMGKPGAVSFDSRCRARMASVLSFRNSISVPESFGPVRNLFLGQRGPQLRWDSSDYSARFSITGATAAFSRLGVVIDPNSLVKTTHRSAAADD